MGFKYNTNEGLINMSESINKEIVIKHKKIAIRKTNDLFEEYISSEDSSLLKKCSLLAYWLEDYTKYIRTEKTFDSTKLKSYKRGDVIKLNFGFNIGSEYGGLHYAVVINNYNPRNSSVLTVIPLTSLKEDKEIHPNDVFLGNEIYRSLKLKHDTITDSLEKNSKETIDMFELAGLLIVELNNKIKELEVKKNTNENIEKLDSFKLELEEATSKINTVEKLYSQLKDKTTENTMVQLQLEKVGAEISRMKSGSIALVDQITTVSKMRIYDPRNSKGVLSGIRLSEDAMDKINSKVKELFIF